MHIFNLERCRTVHRQVCRMIRARKPRLGIVFCPWSRRRGGRRRASRPPGPCPRGLRTAAPLRAVAARMAMWPLMAPALLITSSEKFPKSPKSPTSTSDSSFSESRLYQNEFSTTKGSLPAEPAFPPGDDNNNNNNNNNFLNGYRIRSDRTAPFADADC